MFPDSRDKVLYSSVSLSLQSKRESVSHSIGSNSLWLHGLQPARLLCPWKSPGKNTGVDSHSLLQRIFLTQGLNPALLHCWWTLISKSPGKPYWKDKPFYFHVCSLSFSVFGVITTLFESWVVKNWCFWTMVLEKTLESSLDYMQIKPVHHKGDQSRVFIGRTDFEAFETPILWPPDA